MEYTTNYHLPQWVKTDRIMMDDFNQMCQDIDAGLTSSAAAAAQAKEDAKALPYAVGSYTGTGSTAKEIVVGFKPQVVLIFSNQAASAPDSIAGCFSAAGRIVNSGKITMTDTGFIVAALNTNRYPNVNEVDRIYQYAAFR